MSEQDGDFPKGKIGGGRRPKKAKPGVISSYSIVLGKSVAYTSNGQERQLSVPEALQQKIFDEAMAGKRQSEREVLKWIKQREKYLGKQTAAPKAAVMLYEHGNQRNADRALLLLGIARPHEFGRDHTEGGPQLSLEPEFVKIALARSRLKLTEENINTIQRSAPYSSEFKFPKSISK